MREEESEARGQPVLSVDSTNHHDPSDQAGLREMIRRRIALVLNKLGNDLAMISQAWIGKRTQDTVGPDKSDFLRRKFPRCSINEK